MRASAPLTPQSWQRPARPDDVAAGVHGDRRALAEIGLLSVLPDDYMAAPSSDDFSVGTKEQVLISEVFSVWTKEHAVDRHDLSFPIRPEEGGPLVHCTQDLPAVVDRQRVCIPAGECAQVTHLAIFPDERAVKRAICRGLTDDRAMDIDRGRNAPVARHRLTARARSENPQIAHHPVLPQEGMPQICVIACMGESGDRTPTDDLAASIPRHRERSHRKGCVELSQIHGRVVAPYASGAVQGGTEFRTLLADTGENIAARVHANDSAAPPRMI